MAGIIFYQGPSLIDGSPIVGIAINSSTNRKTGGLIQCYIIRSDIAPLDASKTGADVSICGSCKHRGVPTDNPEKKQAEGRGCYVNLGQGPTIVFKGLKRGIYPQATPEQAQEFTAGQGVRLGAYGDPAAIPKEVWDSMILAKASFWTGYTHNLKVQPSMAELCMVSADSQQQSASAKSHGRRSFRVIPLAQWQAKGKAAVSSHEILCPASTEAGSRVTCDSCKLCNGSPLRSTGLLTGTKSKGKSIAIVAHGSGAKYA